MPSPAERMQILNRLEKGEISPQEAARLLSAEENAAPTDNSPMGILAQLERGEITAEEAARRLEAPRPVVVTSRQAKESSNHKEKVRVRTITNETFNPARTWGWWLLPIALGAVITLLSALWMRSDMADDRMGFGFFLAWLPFLLGIALIVFGWLVRNSNWLHLQVKSHKRGRKVKVDLPARSAYFHRRPGAWIWGAHPRPRARDIGSRQRRPRANSAFWPTRPHPSQQRRWRRRSGHLHQLVAEETWQAAKNV